VQTSVFTARVQRVIRHAFISPAQRQKRVASIARPTHRATAWCCGTGRCRRGRRVSISPLSHCWSTPPR
jgi:hypothetical protein